MKRNFVVSLFGSLIGFGMVFILLSAAGIVGARSAEVRSDVSRANEVSAATPLTSTFTYQGQLKNGGNAVTGSCQMAFRLYDALSSGNLIGSPITPTVPVTNGLFTVGLNFGSNAFNGNGRWLDINVDCGSGATPLTPRQALTAAPYSFYAASTGALQSYPVTTTAPSTGQVLKWNGSAWVPGVDAGGTAYSAGFGLTLIGSQFKVVTSTIQQRVTGTCSAGQYVRSIDASGNVVCGLDANSGGTITNMTAGFGLAGGGSSGSLALNVVTGTVQARVTSSCAISNAIRVINADGSVICAAVGAGGSFWSLTGNAGTNPLTNFLGTTDNVSLTLRVSNTAALRIMPNATSPNIIGGYSGNQVGPNVAGGTIGGGGQSGFVNRVWASYATIGGGVTNTVIGWSTTIGGGENNNAIGSDATVSGGGSNTANGSYTAVGGGLDNVAWGDVSAVGGGYNNIAGNSYSTVSGGYKNYASGLYSTVPGGYKNSASAAYTFAAGRLAQALHTGSFVWADSDHNSANGTIFASTGNDQFLIRASGGVGINTNSPAAGMLDVNSNVIVRGTDIKLNGRGGGQGNSGGAARALVDAGWGGTAVGGGGLYINFANDYGKTTVGSDLVVEGAYIVPTLGTGGSTQLCLNGSNQISDCSSSLRYKSNIANLNLGLDTIAQLRPVTFNWKDSGQADLGFVAEEVNRVTPLLTTLNKDGQIEGVKYDRISAVLVKAVQEQQQQIAALETQNADLTARLSRMEQNTTVSNPTSQAEPFNVSTLLSVIALIAVGWMWLQQRRSKRGEA